MFVRRLAFFTAIAAFMISIASGAGAGTLEERACQKFQEVLRQTPRGITPLGQLSQSGTIKVDDPVATVDIHNAAEVLARDYNFTPSAVRAVTDFWNEIAAGSSRVYREGGTYPFVALENVEGTLNCQHFVFFADRGQGIAPIAGPALDEVLGGLCWTSHADFVRFENERLFIASNEDPAKSDLTAFRITPDEPTLPFCRLRINFNVGFDVLHGKCSQDLCTDLQPELPSLAASFAASGKADLGIAETPLAAIPPAVIERLRQFYGYATLPLPPLRFYRADIDNDGSDELVAVEEIADRPRQLYVIDSPDGAFHQPSEMRVLRLADFSASARADVTPQELFGSAYGEFTDPVDYFPFTSRGKTYLAQIGGGSFGWRQLNGYILAAYDLTGGKLAPAAGFTLTRVNASVKSVDLVK